MSTAMVTEEDRRFFDFLAAYRWPNEDPARIAIYRELVETGELQIETLLENALVRQSGGAYERIAEYGRDFTDDSDAKKCVSCFRNNDRARDSWTNSFAITGTQNKIGLLRAVCYSKQQDRFYFFAIPHWAYRGRSRVEIGLDTSVGWREPQGRPRGKWCRFQVPDFESLAEIREQDCVGIKQRRGRTLWNTLFEVDKRAA